MLKPYEQYKPSGIEWLGDVPEHWEVKRGRFCMRVNPSSERLRELGPEDEVSFVPMEAVGEYGGLNLEIAKQLGDVGSSYTEFQDGDVVVAKITPCFENGKGALAEGLTNGAALGTTELHVLRVLPALDRHFLFYLTISSVYRKTGEAEMYGAGGQKRVPPEFNKDFRTPLPPSVEQRAISDFLDRETAKIDRLVAKKRTLIERLKEKRTALISRTVTRGLPPDAARATGLDPHPKLKPSGIDWLGDVPDGWRSTRLKRIASVCGRIGFRGYSVDDLVDEGDGALVVGGANLTYVGHLDLSNRTYLSWPKYEESPEIKIDLHDVVIGQRGTGTCGKVAIVNADIGPATINPSLVLLKRPRVESRFLCYWLMSELIQSVFDSYLSTTAVPMLTQAQIGNVPVFIPPVAEQRVISDFLDRETARLDKMAMKVKTAVERLQEYRTALITAAVTGKIDVRGTAA